MRKDVKIGMFIGSLLAVTAIVWVSTRPSLTDLELPAGSEPQRREKPADAEKALPDSDADEPGNLAAATESREILKPNEALTESAPIQHKELEKASHEKIHTVAKGETLSDISQRYYRTASGWQKIYIANRDLLSSPDRLRPGMRLIIPE